MSLYLLGLTRDPCNLETFPKEKSERRNVILQLYLQRSGAEDQRTMFPQKRSLRDEKLSCSGQRSITD
jgi:hypothetical protein